MKKNGLSIFQNEFVQIRKDVRYDTCNEKGTEILTKRVIPVMLLSNNRLVRTIKFSQIIDIGNPVSQAKIFSAQDVDEIIFLDITGDSNMRGILEKVSDECFFPITAGGGIKTVEQIRELLNAGADMVILNSEVYKRPSLVGDAAKAFGSQCVLVCIDYLFNEVRFNRGVTPSLVSPLTWAESMEFYGAGEIVLHPIERDGTMQGFDLKTLEEIANKVKIPVVAMGGCGNLQHIVDAFNVGASAVAISSMFAFTDISPIKAKSFLKNSGVLVREI